MSIILQTLAEAVVRNKMKKLFSLHIVLLASISGKCGGNEENFKIFRFGDENLLGTGSDKEINAADYVRVLPERALDKPLPRQLSMCFHMFYLAMDTLNRNQKTILRIYGENDDPSSNSFFMRINNAPPRGTLILNSGPDYGMKWSGGLGDYRYSDLAFRRWSAICISLDLAVGYVVYYIDGRKVADVALADDFKSNLVPWPQKVKMFKVGENMVGDITNLHVYARLLTEEEMEKITTCKLKLSGDYINWKNDSFEAVGKYTKEMVKKMKYQDLCKPTGSQNELFSGRKSRNDAMKFCKQLGSTIPVIRDKKQYSDFDEYVQEIWEKYQNVSNECKGWVVLPQTRAKSNKDTNLNPYFEPFMNFLVEFLPWAEFQPTPLCAESEKGFDGLKVNLNHTDKYPDGYYCSHPQKQRSCFVCKHSTPLPTLFSIRGLCEKSQFNQKYALTRDSGGEHYYQGDSHANITYDRVRTTWVLSSMISQKYERIKDKYSPNITKARTNSTDLTYRSYFLGKQSITIESDPRCKIDSAHNRTILFSNCAEDQFTCEDGHCLSMDFRCNGVVNCPDDNTDEANCHIIVKENTYQKDYAPVKFTNENMTKVNVNISMEIESILTISEKESLIKLKLMLKILWFDHRLEFNNLNNVTSMNTIPAREKEHLWLPPVMFANTEFRDGITNDEKAFITIRKLGKYSPEDIEILENRLSFKGEENPIIYSRPYTVELSCTYNMAWYPFDIQHCRVVMAMEGNSGLYVRLLSNSVQYLGPTELSQYFVKRIKIDHDDKTVWAELVLGRRLLSTILTVYVPTFLLNVISYATNFFKDFFFEAVVTVNLTAMLVLTTMFISTSTSLPTTSYIKMVDIWLLFNLFLPFLVVLLHTYMDTLRDEEDREVNHHGQAVEVASSSEEKEQKDEDEEKKKKTNDSWVKGIGLKKNLVSVKENIQQRALRDAQSNI